MTPRKVQTRGEVEASLQGWESARSPLCRASWLLGSLGSLLLRALLPIPQPLGTTRTLFLLLDSCHGVF